MTPLIEVRGLKTTFDTDLGLVRAVNGVDFTIEREKTLGVVGESGCGKSVTALSIMELIRNPGKIEAGEFLFHQNGTTVDLANLNPRGPKMRPIRGNDIAMTAAFMTIRIMKQQILPESDRAPRSRCGSIGNHIGS